MQRESVFGHVVVVVLALAVLATLIDAASWRRKPSLEPRLLTVTASAYREAEPDVAKISLGVKAVRPTPKEAATQVAQTVTAIKARLTRLGVRSESLETSELYLGPATEYDSARRRTVQLGYKAYHWLRVTLKGGSFDRLPEVVDGAVEAGATSFSGLVWELADENSVRSAALRLATERASEKARAMADGARARIAGIQSISEQYSYDGDYTEHGMGAERAAGGGFSQQPASAAEAPLGMPEVPGKLRISCHVKVAFLLR
jgi:hypothetical protein